MMSTGYTTLIRGARIVDGSGDPWRYGDVALAGDRIVALAPPGLLAAEAAADDSVAVALAGSAPLGWFVSFVLRPDPTRLAPSAPYDSEAESWRRLEREFEDRLRRR